MFTRLRGPLAGRERTRRTRGGEKRGTCEKASCRSSADGESLRRTGLRCPQHFRLRAENTPCASRRSPAVARAAVPTRKLGARRYDSTASLSTSSHGSDRSECSCQLRHGLCWSPSWHRPVSSHHERHAGCRRRFGSASSGSRRRLSTSRRPPEAPSHVFQLL